MITFESFNCIVCVCLNGKRNESNILGTLFINVVTTNRVYFDNFGFIFTNFIIVEYFIACLQLSKEIKMAQKDMITGKKPLVGNHVSHANNKVKRRQNPNLHWKNIQVH